MILAVETRAGWFIKCRACQRHLMPTKYKIPEHNWSFNGDVELPTFTPSMNETSNDPSCEGYNLEHASRRCHFNVTKGKITYHNDCTHGLRGEMDLEPFTQEEVERYARHLKESQS